MQAYKDDGMKVPVFAWVDGVEFEDSAKKQVDTIARMPFMFHHVAIMPDVHWGLGATVGSVLATKGAIVPASVGVDLGCGMNAVRTSLTASDLPDDLGPLRREIERRVPHGRTNDGRPGDRGAWHTPRYGLDDFAYDSLSGIIEKHPKMTSLERGIAQANGHLGTLGTGNHFIEVCLDEEQRVWIMLHSGSRGIGNRIGSYFIEKAKEQADKYFYAGTLPDKDLAYLVESTPIFDDYLEAVGWAQDYAFQSRQHMLSASLAALGVSVAKTTAMQVTDEAINCHHNYVTRERHYGKDGVIVTRKGAVSAKEGELGIIPGSMGAKSFIVRGKGNRDSFHSCSHGAGRRLGRNEAKRQITMEDFEKQMVGVESRRDADVIDEAPAAYKSIDAVIAAQGDLIDVVHTLKQVVCVKG